jgi:hypothetical protein
MKKLFFILLINFLLCIATFSLQAQVSKMVQKYPNSKAICIKKLKEIHLTTIYKDKKQTQKDSIACKSSYYTEVLHNDIPSPHLVNENINYSQFQEITSLKAYTLLPNQKKIKVDNIVTQTILGENIFFDDMKAKTFVYPAICAGAKTVLEYEEILHNVNLLGSYYFNTHLPVEESVFRVITSKNINLGYKVFGNVAIQFKKTYHNNQIIYEWKASQLAPLKNEENTAKKQDDEPHIILYLLNQNDTKQGENTHKLALNNLYHWYYGMTKGNYEQQATTIQLLADSLTKNYTNQYQKAKKLYEWVQKNIQYVAFEDGLGGLIPRSPVEVCHKKYGDCKDMATLLFSLGRAAKIPTYLVWVGTRNVPYKYSELAAPMVDNHLVTAFELNQEYVFADATAEYLPFGMPSDFIQGKEGLLGLDSANYKIVVIPTEKAEKSIFRDSLSLQFNDNQLLMGSGKIITTGFHQAKTFKKYHQIDKNQQQKIVSKNNNNIKVQAIQKTDSIISYQITPQYLVKEIGNDVFVNMHLDKKLASEKIDTLHRQTAYYIDFPQKYICEVALNFQQEWQSNYTPPNYSFEHTKFSFHITYQHIGLQLVMRKEIIIHCLTIEKEDFLAWNTMIEELNKAYQESVSWNK